MVKIAHVLGVFVLACVIRIGTCSEDEFNLQKYIHSLYTVERTLVLPRTEVNQTVNVTYSLQPHTMIEANKETKIFTLLAWEHLEWTDPSLRWSPDDYGEINSTRVMPDTIWTPDIDMVNSVDVNMKRSRVRLVVRSNGDVTWSPKAMLRVRADFAPIGVQHPSVVHCSFKMRSQTYDVSDLNLMLGDPVLGHHHVNVTTTSNTTPFRILATSHNPYGSIVTTCDRFPSLEHCQILKYHVINFKLVLDPKPMSAASLGIATRSHVVIGLEGLLLVCFVLQVLQ